MTDSPGPAPRLRLHYFIVQPVLVWDDGSSLVPALGPHGGHLVNPQLMQLDDLQHLAEHWPERLAEIVAQITPDPTVASAAESPSEHGPSV